MKKLGEVLGCNGEIYDVAKVGKMWFFQLQGHPDAGWTAASPEFRADIEDQLRQSGKPPQ